MKKPPVDDVQFSRSTELPAALGKATETLKTRVPDSVKWDFARLARELHMDESRFLRELVMLRLYGSEAVARMRVAEVAMVAGEGPK